MKQTLNEKVDHNFKYIRTILGDDMGDPTTTTQSSQKSTDVVVSPTKQPTPPVPFSTPRKQSVVGTNNVIVNETFVPYQNLPHVFRASFDFIRKEFKQYVEKSSEKLSKQIEESISKSTKEILETVDKKNSKTNEDISTLIEQRTNQLSRQLQDKVTDLNHTMSRNLAICEEVDKQLQTAVQSVTTFSQRLEKRFTERFEEADHRAQCMEDAFSRHLGAFSDLSTRINPLIGNEEMDMAISGGEYLITNNINPLQQQESSSSYRYEKKKASSPINSRSNKFGGSPVLQQQEQQQQKESNNNNNATTLANANNSGSFIRVKQHSSAPALLDENDFEKSMEIFKQQSSATSPQQRQQQQQQQQHIIPSSLVGSIDVEVLASHDARAIAMLSTAPFVALRHQVLQDTKMRITAARDSIIAELENHLAELREEIIKRPLPTRVSEMIRDMTSDRQVPEQLALIRQHLQSLETGKIGFKTFNDALKSKADVTVAHKKANTEDLTTKFEAIHEKLQFLREDLSGVQTERAQFRNMLREVLYMHRRAQALSGGGGINQNESHTAAHAMRFISEEEGDKKLNTRNPVEETIHENAREIEKSLRVRDPTLPQIGPGYEIVSPHDPRSPNYKNPPPTAPTAASSPRRQGSMHFSASTQKRSAQKLVEEIASASISSSPKTAGSFRRKTSTTQQQSSSSSSSLPALTQIGSRDMTQKFERKIYTPTDERQDPPMDPL
jgi:hypothetical protein